VYHGNLSVVLFVFLKALSSEFGVGPEVESLPTPSLERNDGKVLVFLLVSPVPYLILVEL
jgi:hypothetical protein